MGMSVAEWMIEHTVIMSNSATAQSIFMQWEMGCRSGNERIWFE